MKKPKPSPYPDLKAAIQGRNIISFKYVTLVVPVTRLARDMNMNYATLRFRLIEPMTLTMKEMKRLAALLQMDVGDLFMWLCETSKDNAHE